MEGLLYAYCANNPIRFIDLDGREVKEGISSVTYTGLDAQNAFDDLKRAVCSAFSISNHIANFFGLNDDPKNIDQHKATKERLRKTNENLEDANDALSMIVPGYSLIELMAGINNGDASAAWAAVPFVLLDAATMGKGKAGTTALRKTGTVLESVNDVFANPSLLKGQTPALVQRILGKTPGRQVETLGKGAHQGQGMILREYGAKGPTGRMIQWHSGGGHHGVNPYWKVSSGAGTFRMF